MAEEPEQVLPEEALPPSAGLKKWVLTSRSMIRKLLATITAGMANRIMNEVTRIAQR